MSYQIISKEVNGETINTVVVFTINGKELEPISIAHFMPQSKEEIIQGIENREISEKRRIEAIEKNVSLLNEL